MERVDRVGPERGYEPEPPQIADRRFQDYYYDSDVPEAVSGEAALQNVQYDETDSGTENAVRSRPPPRKLQNDKGGIKITT